MGNPNARPKAKNLRRTSSQLSNHTYNSAISPKTPTKRGAFDSGSTDTDSNMGDYHGASMRKDSVESGIANLSFQEESPTKASLKFKSYKTGTLITNNGVPANGFIAAFPPPKASPLPSSKVSQLSATTPAFVPRTPQLPVALAKNVLPTPNTGTPAVQRIQNLLDDFRSPGLSQVQQQYNPFYTPATSGPSSLMPTPEYHQPGPVRPPRVYYQRADKSKKDIIIGATGVVRNAVKVVESFLPNGSPYHEYYPEFDGPHYDFVAEFNKMSTKDKMDLVANKQVEILVKLATYDGEEKVEMTIIKKKGKKKGPKGRVVAAPLDGTLDAGNGGFSADFDVYLAELNAAEGGPSMMTADIKGKGKEKEVTMEVGGYGGAKEATTVIDTINALGPDFTANTKSLYVTLDFTSIAVAESSEPASIPTGPRGSPSALLLSGKLSFGANFNFITSLVRTLQSFTALKHVVINLRVHSSHSSRPISIPQLTLVLPFYDLGFTDWKISYQTEFFTTSIPVRDHDYPLKWLDRERNKILREREKKVNNAVFVRRSSVEGKVANWRKQK
ncbi:hypothetical protein N431DRAFT_563827 [Stipitochalara longipes BDJ]|nr:hypothetical protein N431DRAFT_563827 [Stipitochalara longipes BDJ]